MSKRPSDYGVEDAKRDLVLEITTRDINGAEKMVPNACAAANALCRQERFKEARVFKTKTYVKDIDGNWYRYLTPKDLYIEIMIFDRGGKMMKGDYILKAPTGSQKLGAHTKPTGKKKRSGIPMAPHRIENVRESAPKGPGAAAHFK